jgi:branched-chain amino acid transport system ATP-binding protein
MSILTTHIPEAGYGKKTILHNIDLDIKRGSIVSFIGPNGAGKSTLLKALMGIVGTPKGKIKLNDKEITTIPVEQRVQEGIAFVPQGNRVFTELTVRENLEIGGYLRNDKKKISDVFSEIVTLFPDLKDRFDKNAGVLSGGEKQQLALARALMVEPGILLLDEPSLGLSPKNVTVAFNLIEYINKMRGTTILIVEQKVREVLKISHHVYALKMGEIVFNGNPADLQQGDQLKKIFLS